MLEDGLHARSHFPVAGSICSMPMSVGRGLYQGYDVKRIADMMLGWKRQWGLRLNCRSCCGKESVVPG